MNNFIIVLLVVYGLSLVYIVNWLSGIESYLNKVQENFHNIKAYQKDLKGAMTSLRAAIEALQRLKAIDEGLRRASETKLGENEMTFTTKAELNNGTGKTDS
ncbi:MAG: hypothetical protein IJF84_13565 [Thermoguttaceae bacterium]|nr:hypothetical protein [Thermoguttaceae bacterium]